MRSDLSDAKAAIDWAVSQIPVLQKRIIAWKRKKLYSIRIDADSEPGKKLYRLRHIKALDPVINAEAGMIVHAIRSSLDLLACALAARNGVVGSKSTYFPIWRSAADWADPGSEVLKKVKRLSDADIAAIKDLRPYPGGNNLLVALHNLDLTRKHRRLLGARIGPRGITLMGYGITEWDLRDWKNGFKKEAVLAATDAATPDGKIYLNIHVAIDEGVPVSPTDVRGTLSEFAREAYRIVKSFKR